MSSRLRSLLNGALFATACLLAVDIAGQVVAAGQVVRSPAAATLPAPAAADRSWASRQVILDRNLFDGSALALAPVPVQTHDIGTTETPVATRVTFDAHAMLDFLYDQAQLLPQFEGDGQMVGLQVNAIQAGSLFEKIGLENGDVITEFNGIPMRSQAETATVVQQVVAANEYHVVGHGPDGSERIWDFVR